jgi:hypothetical protein
MKKGILIILAIALMGGGAAYWYVFVNGAKHHDPLKSDQLLQVEAKKLFNDYTQFEDSANKIYNGKVLQVKGQISQIDFQNNRYTISLATDDAMGVVLCEMDTTDNAQYAQLKAQSMIELAGFCNGLNFDVYLDRCKLVK